MQLQLCCKMLHAFKALLTAGPSSGSAVSVWQAVNVQWHVGIHWTGWVFVRWGPSRSLITIMCVLLHRKYTYLVVGWILADPVNLKQSSPKYTSPSPFPHCPTDTPLQVRHAWLLGA
jgi:hypothetical protein